jgi:hypothetical protein
VSLRGAIARFRSAPLDLGVVDIPRVRGSDSTAVQGADGKWSVLDVPLFADTTREFHDVKGRALKYEARGEWHEKAIERAAERYAETGYLPRLIVRHTEKGKDREGVGFFMPRRVRTMKVDGESKRVTFGDYVGLDDGAYQRLKRGEFPYRSAETPIDGRPEFKAMALLPSEEPFHHFGPTTIGREVRNAQGRLTPADTAFRFSSATKTARLLLRFNAMPDTPNASATQTEPVAAATAAPGSVESKIDEVLATLKTIAERLAGGDESDDDTTEAKPVKDPEGPAAMSGDDASAKFAALEGENAGLKTRIAKMETEAATEKAIKKAAAALKGRDGQIGGDPETVVRAAFAKYGSIAAMEAHIEGLAKMTAAEPGEEHDPVEATPESKTTADFATEFDAMAAVGAGAIPLDGAGKRHTRDSWVAHRTARAAATK